MKPALRPKEVEEIFGVGRDTVRRWAKGGKLTVFRTPGGHRRYPADQVAIVLATEPGSAGSWLYPLVAAAEPRRPRCTTDHDDSVCIFCCAWARYDAIPKALRDAAASWAAEQ